MATATKEKYIEGIGRRKTAIARVRITPAKQNSFVVNEKTVDEFFKTPALQKVAMQCANLESLEQKFSVSAKVLGGGTNAQAEAVRHGMARALMKFDENLHDALKEQDLLKRDPRMVERKKFGKVKARKAKQWSKR